MRKIYKCMTILCILTTISLVGCSSGSGVTKRDVATVAGGVGGGIAGSALTSGSAAGTIAGTLGGAYVGNQLAK